MADNRFTRTGSGTYRLDGIGTPVGTPTPAPAPPVHTSLSPTPAVGVRPAAPLTPALGVKPATGSMPIASQATPVPAAAPPMARPGQKTGLPTDPHERSHYLGELARKDLENQRWASAESNLLLALTWDGGNAEYKAMLDEVRRTREELRASRS